MPWVYELHLKLFIYYSRCQYKFYRTFAPLRQEISPRLVWKHLLSPLICSHFCHQLNPFLKTAWARRFPVSVQSNYSFRIKQQSCSTTCLSSFVWSDIVNPAMWLLHIVMSVLKWYVVHTWSKLTDILMNSSPMQWLLSSSFITKHKGYTHPCIFWICFEYPQGLHYLPERKWTR